PDGFFEQSPVGHTVRAAIERGEPLVRDRVAPDGLSGLAAQVPPGRVAIAVPAGANTVRPAPGDAAALIVGCASGSAPAAAATVSSRHAARSSPPATRRPCAPVEKSPETGFTPECRPVTDCTSTASPTSASSSACVFVPAAGAMARAPALGVDLNPPRTADA